MKSLSAREREDRFHNPATCRFDLPLHRGQVTGVYHHQYALTFWIIRREAAGKSTIEEACVIGAIVFKFPAEHGLIKSFCARDVASREFNVIDLLFRFCFAHVEYSSEHIA